MHSTPRAIGYTIIFIGNNTNMKEKNTKSKETLRSPFDPNGSYTGAPENGDKPVQDADDL